MKNYIVRLMDYDRSIIYGDYYRNTTAELAEIMFVAKCHRLGIVISEKRGHFITVEEVPPLF